MLYNLFNFIHETLNLHFWDLPTLLIGVIMIIMLIVHTHNQRKREKKFEEARKEKLEELQKELQAAPASEDTVNA